MSAQAKLPEGAVHPLSKQTTPRVVDVALRYLKEEGVRLVYGIPGGLLHPFFAAIEADDELAIIATKHEEGAAFMADGAARVTGRIAVCAGTSGPGATNLMTGVACAFADGVPLLVITGQAATHALGKGAAQETTREDIDIVEMFRPVTKYSAMVTSAGGFAHHLRRALRRALTGRPGPVHLNIPVDIWEQPIPSPDWFDASTYRPSTRTFDRQLVQRAGDVLLQAEYPVLLAGSGTAIAGAEAHLRSLAELLPARVCTSPRAKGVFPETHELSLGVLGTAGHAQARDTVLGSKVDVLFTVGASLNETTTFNWKPELRPRDALIQLDIDADRVGRNYPIDVPLVGDAQSILMELVYHMHRQIREGAYPKSKWASEPAPARGTARFDDGAMRESDQIPLAPQRWRADLQAALPDNAVIFSDIGGHMLFNIHHLAIGERQRFVINLGFGSMGHGTIAPIGAAMTLGDRPVFAIVGDACFTMNGMDLLTAVEYDAPVIWIVENNNMQAITWHASRVLSKGTPMACAKWNRRIEIAAIARAMGLRSWVVDAPDQIGKAVAEALAGRAPSLIEVRTDSSISPPLGARAKSLAGFIEAEK